MTLMDEQGNIKYVARDTFDLHLVDIREDSVIVDFTNWDHKLKIFKQIGGQPILVFEGTDIDKSIPGSLRFYKTPNDMQISPGKYYYDWVVTRPNGKVETWINNKNFIVE